MGVDAGQAVLLTQRLLGVAAVLAAAEGIAARRRFPRQGLLSWRISRLQRPRLSAGRSGAFLQALLGGDRIWWVLGGRLVAGGVLVVVDSRPVAVVAVAALIVLQLAMQVGLPQGNDGSDQIMLIVAVAVLLARLAAPGSTVVVVCLVFITAQLLLSYVAAGVSKLAGPTWRSGAAVGDITATRTYGAPVFAQVIDRAPTVGRLASWGTIAFEVSMPAVLFLPTTAALGLLGAAVGFHLSVAAVMGLNSFVPAFLTGYPALLWAADQLH